MANTNLDDINEQAGCADFAMSNATKTAALKSVDHALPETAFTVEGKAASVYWVIEDVAPLVLSSRRPVSTSMALDAAGSLPLLAAWGSQDNTRCAVYCGAVSDLLHQQAGLLAMFLQNHG